MKLTAGIIAAFASCATAALATGQAFIFPHENRVASAASLSRSLTRLIILQRLSGPGKGPTIKDFPKDMSVDEVVEVLNDLATPDHELFPSMSTPTPKRLLLLIDGMTQQQIGDAKKALGQDVSFTIDDLPSSSGNHDLFQFDLKNIGTKTDHKCSPEEMLQMQKDNCWGESSTAARYSVSENTNIMAEILKALPLISKQAKAGTLHAIVVFLPETSDQAVNSWDDTSSGELRRRQAEQVISSNHNAESESATHAASSSETPIAPMKPIPSCFDSKDACIDGTGNCSSHGECLNKYGKVPENPKEGQVCFTCHCQGTHNTNSSPTYWGGPTCAKQDVSVPFWLFFGFTIVMIGILRMAIGLLFSVGEEKLPGVIGAGVSRSK